FTIQNTGTGPLNVTRVGIRTSPSDPRTPPGVSAELEGGGASAKIPPDGEKRVIVHWKTAGVRAQELYGHVLVESDSVAEGATEPGRPVAMGIFAQKNLGLGVFSNHILSIITFLPLLGVVAIFLAHLLDYKDDKKLRLFTVILMGVNLVLATWL